MPLDLPGFIDMDDVSGAVAGVARAKAVIADAHVGAMTFIGPYPSAAKYLVEEAVRRNPDAYAYLEGIGQGVRDGAHKAAIDPLYSMQIADEERRANLEAGMKLDGVANFTNPVESWMDTPESTMTMGAPAPGEVKAEAPPQPIIRSPGEQDKAGRIVPDRQTTGEAFNSGMQASVTGMNARNKLPDAGFDPSAPLPQRIAYQVGKLVPDLWELMAAGSLGTVLAAETGPVAPVIGTAFAFGTLKAKERETIYRLSTLEHDEVLSLYEGVKEGMKGFAEGGIEGAFMGAGGLAGGKAFGAATRAMGLSGEALSGVAGKAAAASAKGAGEVAGMVTGGAVVTGEAPTMQDIMDAGVLLAVLNGGKKSATAMGVAGRAVGAAVFRGEAPQAFVRNAAAKEAIARAEGLGAIDPKTAEAARYMVDKDPYLDMNTVLSISKNVRFEKGAALMEADPTAKGLDPEANYQVFGQTRPVPEGDTGFFKTTVDLYRGAQPRDVYHEFYHRFYDSLDATAKKELADFQAEKAKAGDKSAKDKSRREYFAELGADFMEAEKLGPRKAARDIPLKDIIRGAAKTIKGLAGVAEEAKTAGFPESVRKLLAEGAEGKRRPQRVQSVQAAREAMPSQGAKTVDANASFSSVPADVESIITRMNAKTEGEVERLMSSEPLPAVAKKYSGNFNHERVNTIDDVHRLVDFVAQSIETELFEAKGGVVSHATTKARAIEALANDMNMRPEALENLWKQGGPGSFFGIDTPEAKITAVRVLNVKAWEEVSRIKDLVLDPATNSTEAKFQLAQALAFAKMMSAVATNNSAAIARALNAHKITARTDIFKQMQMAEAINNAGDMEGAARALKDIEDAAAAGALVDAKGAISILENGGMGDIADILKQNPAKTKAVLDMIGDAETLLNDPTGRKLLTAVKKFGGEKAREAVAVAADIQKQLDGAPPEIIKLLTRAKFRPDKLNEMAAALRGLEDAVSSPIFSENAASWLKRSPGRINALAESLAKLGDAASAPVFEGNAAKLLGRSPASLERMAAALNSMEWVLNDPLFEGVDIVALLSRSPATLARLANVTEAIRNGGKATIAQLNRAMKPMDKPGLIDVALELRVMGLLSNMKTQVANITSNFATAMLAYPEYKLAEAAGKYSSDRLFRRGDIYDRLVEGESEAWFYGFHRAWGDALRYAYKSFMTGEETSGISTTGGKTETPRSKAFSAEVLAPSWRTGNRFQQSMARGIDLLGEALRLPGRGLVAGDELFKVLHYQAQLYRDSYHTAFSEGLRRGTPEFSARMDELYNAPTDDMIISARKSARYFTFTEDLEGMAMHLQRAQQSRVGRAVVPFMRTPWNIGKFAAQRTPLLNLATAQFRADFKAGGARRDVAVARVTLGSSLLGVSAGMAAMGMVTGGGPKESARRNGWLADYKPYSFRFPGTDTWVEYNRIEPFGMLLGIGADFYEIASHWYDEDGEMDDLAFGLSAAFSKAILSKTWMRGAAEFLNAVTDVDRNGREYLTDFIASFAPVSAGSRAIARTIDPVVRETDSLLDEFKAITPGLSATLPPKRDIYGQEIPIESMYGGINNWLLPFGIHTSRGSYAEDKMNQAGIGLNRPSKNVEVNGKSIKLGPWAYDTYQQLAGKTVLINGRNFKMALDETCGHPDFDLATTEEQQSMVQNTAREYRREARERLVEMGVTLTE